MIELNATMFWINLSFVVFALIIFALFYARGMLSSLYDLIMFTITLIALFPLARLFASHFPLLDAMQFDAGIQRIIAARYANPILWGIIWISVLFILFIIIKKPLLRKIPLTLNRKFDKALSFLISSIVVFLIGTLLTSALLTPLFANGSKLVNNSILIVFKNSAKDLITTTQVNLDEYTILTKLMAQEPLTLADHDDIVNFIMTFDVPRDIATTLTHYALALEVTPQARDAVIAYAQSQGFTIHDIRLILRGLGLSEAYITQLLDIKP